MMGKGLMYSLFFIILSLTSCSKGQHLGIDKINNSPVFKLDITIDGKDVKVNAGKDDYFMLTEFEEKEDFVMKKGMISRYSPALGATKPTFGLSTVSYNTLSKDFFNLNVGSYLPFTKIDQTKWLIDIKPLVQGVTSSIAPVFILVDGQQTELDTNSSNIQNLDDVSELTIITSYQENSLFYTIGNTEEGEEFKHLLSKRAVQFKSEDVAFKFQLTGGYEWTDVVIQLPNNEVLNFDASTNFTEPGEYIFTLFDEVSGAYVYSNFIVEKIEVKYAENSVFVNTTFHLQDKELYEKYFVFEYIDDNGAKFSSVDFSDGHYFNVLDISPFEQSPQNTPTQKVTVEFDIPMADSLNEQIISVKGEGVIALPVNN